MKGRITKLGAIAIATAIGFATVAALVQAADPISDRRELMKGNGAAMKAIDGVLKNGGSAADLEKHANQLNDTAMKIGTLFPAGTDQPQGKEPGQTRALPEIWASPDKFTAEVKKFQEEAAMFKTAVAGGDMGVISAEFDKLGGVCGDCHKQFRAK
jgi:cytochrome c556